MRVLLDTHVLVKAATDRYEELRKRLLSLLEDSDVQKLVSVVSFTEIAIKAQIAKINLDAQRISAAAEALLLTVIPYTAPHAYRLFDLPLLHRDPFDRMLIATALSEDVPLVSVDRQFPKYRGLRLWK